MAGKVKPVPDGYHTVTPYLSVKGASDAIAFYKKAFGAEELVRMPMPDGRVGHAELQLGDSRIMLADEMPEMADAVTKSPRTLGGSTAGLALYVPDVDALFKRAVDAGAEDQAARSPTSSTAIAARSSRIRSATSGRSRRTSRTSRPRR